MTECYVLYAVTDYGSAIQPGSNGIITRIPAGTEIMTDTLQSEHVGVARVRDVKAQLEAKHNGADVVVLNVIA